MPRHERPAAQVYKADDDESIKARARVEFRANQKTLRRQGFTEETWAENVLAFAKAEKRGQVRIVAHKENFDT